VDFDYGYNGYAAQPNYVPWWYIELGELGKQNCQSPNTSFSGGCSYGPKYQLKVSEITPFMEWEPIKNNNLWLAFRALT
jgi:hypothetical protein